MKNSNRGIDVIERIKMKSKISLSGCLLFTGALTPNGYAHIRLNGKMVMAHRVMYERYIGMIPEGLEIDHICRRRNCVNPSHMEAVSHQENVARGQVGIGWEDRHRDSLGRFCMKRN